MPTGPPHRPPAPAHSRCGAGWPGLRARAYGRTSRRIEKAAVRADKREGVPGDRVVTRRQDQAGAGPVMFDGFVMPVLGFEGDLRLN